MKLLTLNTHSLMEPNYEEKLDAFLQFILRERPDLVALQEVNQPASAALARDSCAMFRLPETGAPLREGNHALRIAQALRHGGIPASWAYLPIKLGYGGYDEGAAILSMRGEITAADVRTISTANDYRDWRTRRVLGVQLACRPEWFYSVHMGWWRDEKEPFANQWRRLNDHLSGKRLRGRVWLLGDFNAPAELRGEGYDLISASGWQDSFLLAGERDDGITVAGAIDGWDNPPGSAGMRIDHIWCSDAVPAKRSRVVFNGRDDAVVSDHFGVMIEI